ncbi:hypothetical protein B0H19DRAFT_1081243 [Mycena capillaripes]|nr:hypothetical protein B0H19DRAFT_1081243 [Mycena capillaripes]
MPHHQTSKHVINAILATDATLATKRDSASRPVPLCVAVTMYTLIDTDLEQDDILKGGECRGSIITHIWRMSLRIKPSKLNQCFIERRLYASSGSPIELSKLWNISRTDLNKMSFQIKIQSKPTAALYKFYLARLSEIGPPILQE